MCTFLRKSLEHVPHQNQKSPKKEEDSGSKTQKVYCQGNRRGNVDERWVRYLGQEDPLEEGLAAHSSILAWRIPWKEELGGLQAMRFPESDKTEKIRALHYYSQLV